MIIINVCKFFYLLIECFLCCKLIQICAFILQGIDIGPLGESDAGKSYLAKAIGIKACNRYNVVYFHREELLKIKVALKEQDYDKYARKMKKYLKWELIILDEPTVGLDPKQIIEIRDLIKSLKKKHTVILSSHILSEVSAVCDYVLIISHGKLVASDTPDNLGKLAQGSNNLSLLVKGDKDKIRILLGEIEGIKEIAINVAKDQEGWEVKLSTEENTDIREEVFFKMAEHHYPILEMQSKKVSLEEIFLELTEDDKKKKPEEPEKEGETK